MTHTTNVGPNTARRPGRIPATKSAIVTTMAVLVLFVLPAVAHANVLTWSAPIAVDHEGQQRVACPSSTQCVATDALGAILNDRSEPSSVPVQAVSFDPAAPGSPAPTTIDTVDRIGTIDGAGGLACTSATQCVAVDDAGNEVTFNPASPAGATRTFIDTNSDKVLTGIACPSASSCVAVDADGQEIDFNPAAPGTPTPQSIGGSGSPAAVACPSTGMCVAVDQSGAEFTFNPSTGSVSASSTVDSNFDVSGVACNPAGTQCAAVDAEGAEVTFAPSAPGSPSPTTIDAGRALAAVACPSASQCTAVDRHGEQVTFGLGAVGSPVIATVAAGSDLESLACPSASSCTAVDQDGHQVTFSVSSPGPATPTTINGGAAGLLNAVACASATVCAAVDAAGQELTLNPSALIGATATTIDPGDVLSGAACPSTGECVALDQDLKEFTFDPAHASAASPGTGAVDGLYGDFVGCASPSLCVAEHFGAGNEVTFDPATPSSGTSTLIERPPSGGGPYTPDLDLVACPSSTECATVDTESGEGFTFNPSAPGSPAGARLYNVDPEPVAGIACPSVTECVIVPHTGGEVTFNPQSLPASIPTPATVDAGGQLRGVACPSVSSCTAVDDSGGAVTFDPRSPGTPARTVIDGGAVLAGVACSSETACVAVDQSGHALVGSSAPVNDTPPVISGTHEIGHKLSATTGKWSGAAPISYSYQWQRCGRTCSNVSRATKSTYALGKADVGDHVKVRVRAGNPVGSSVAASALAGPVAGAPKVSGSLTGVKSRKARLRFTVSKGADAPSIKTIAVSLPNGLTFTASKRTLNRALRIAVARTKKPKHSVKAHGRRALTISLKKAAPKAQVTISSKAIVVSKQLVKKIKRHKVKTLTVVIKASNSSHQTTSLSLKAKVH